MATLLGRFSQNVAQHVEMDSEHDLGIVQIQSQKEEEKTAKRLVHLTDKRNATCQFAKAVSFPSFCTGSLASACCSFSIDLFCILYFRAQYIEDITRWREDTNYTSEWQERPLVLHTNNTLPTRDLI